jgi:hypothetical protein
MNKNKAKIVHKPPHFNLYQKMREIEKWEILHFLKFFTPKNIK